MAGAPSPGSSRMGDGSRKVDKALLHFSSEKKTQAQRRYFVLQHFKKKDLFYFISLCICACICGFVCVSARGGQQRASNPRVVLWQQAAVFAVWLLPRAQWSAQSSCVLSSRRPGYQGMVYQTPSVIAYLKTHKKEHLQ